MSDHEGRGRVKVEEGHKRVRAYLGGRLVADTTTPLLVWEIPYFPAYYFPAHSVLAELTPTGHSEHSPSRGDAVIYDVKVEGRTALGAARRYAASPLEELRDAVKFEWDLMDEWMEEDEPVYTHPRDPYTRVDILASSRHVQIQIHGVTVAESRCSRALFETGLPVRWYVPYPDLKMELLRPSQTVTHCPYKGTANYWSVQIDANLFEDVVWTYRAPLPESQKIAGLAAFYNERVDLYLDGILQERPKSRQ